MVLMQEEIQVLHTAVMGGPVELFLVRGREGGREGGRVSTWGRNEWLEGGWEGRRGGE